MTEEKFQENPPACAYPPCPFERSKHPSGLCEDHAGLFDFLMHAFNVVRIGGRPIMQILATTANAQNQIERASALRQAQVEAGKLVNLNGKAFR